MLVVDSALKALYKQDSIPKYYTITFASIPLTINTAGTNDKIVSGSFSLDESICSDTGLVFGSCEASEIKFTVADITQDLTGLEFTVTQTVGAYTIALGTYTVASCKKQDNKRFKDIIAYDAMTKFDVDVSAWYNALDFTGLTLSAFRASLCAYIGITEATATALPNDTMTVEETIAPTQISGRDVLRAIEEISGAFGHIARDGKFTHIVLKPMYGLYPSVTLYPSATLYPVSETDKTTVTAAADETITKSMYQQNGVRFEEYTAAEIDKLIIRQEEDDVGAIVGTGSNAYIIEGNFLVFGKSAAELETIATNAFGNIAKRPYRPYRSNNIGLPYLEVGDMVKFNTDDPVTGYVLQRTLSGIQALKDEYIAEGTEEREPNFGLNKEIIQLKGKTAIIKKTVEEVSVSVTDLDLQLTAEMNVLAGEIELKVDSAGVISAINLSPEAVKISAAKIDLEGYVTITNLGTPGSVEIDGGNLKAGTVTADTVRATWVYAGNINASQITAGTISGNLINGGTISGVTFVSEGLGSFRVEISTGRITLGTVATGNYAELDGGGLYFYNNDSAMVRIYSTGTLQVPDIDATSVSAETLYASTSATVGGYLVLTTNSTIPYASSAGNASQLGNAVYVSGNGNLRPISDLYGSCGTELGRWSSVWSINGAIQTSDRNKKNSITDLDERFVRFAKMITPKLFKMNEGTSGRFHVGFIAQDVESAMTECGITDMEFAGLIKAPMYSKMVLDEDGNELPEYDKTSEVVGYHYGLRYEEFIPLLFIH